MFINLVPKCNQERTFRGIECFDRFRAVDALKFDAARECQRLEVAVGWQAVEVDLRSGSIGIKV